MTIKVLFIPQTQRNYLLLRSYAAGLAQTYDTHYLRSTVFGSECDMGSGEPEDTTKVSAPAFLMPQKNLSSWRARIVYQLRSHRKLKAYLRELSPALVVIGIDAGGFGRWVAVAANECKIPTLCCQEGCTFAFDWYRRTWKLALKRSGTNLLLRLVFPPAMDVHNEKEFTVCNYAAVWGEYCKREIVRRHIQPPNRVWVIGDPRFDKRSSAASPDRNGVLFLDSPFETWPPGVCDLKAIERFRQGVVEWARAGAIKLIYKTHPLTRPAELEKIRAIAGKLSTVHFIESGTADQLYAQAQACLTFPSTALFGILASHTPLIQVHLPRAAFPRIYWDPVERFGAGITITSANGLDKAWQMVCSAEWRSQYESAAQKASVDALGPQDGKSSGRFAELVDSLTGTPE